MRAQWTTQVHSVDISDGQENDHVGGWVSCAYPVGCSTERQDRKSNEGLPF